MTKQEMEEKLAALLNQIAKTSSFERTLRDSFAEAALPGILAGPLFHKCAAHAAKAARAGHKEGFTTFDFVAGQAYVLADAMLRQRGKSEQEPPRG